MKKILSFFLALLFLVSVFTGCQITKPNNPNDTTDSQELSSDSDPFAVFGEESPVSDFKYETNEDNGITITKYIGSDTHVVIPQKIDGKDVTEIGYWAFQNRSKLIAVKMPNSVLTINGTCFVNCTALTTVVLSKNLVTIHGNAFEKCSSLSNIILPKTLTRIGDYAFLNCTSLKYINIPKNLSSWGTAVFMDSGLETVDFEEGLEVIGDTAFCGTNIREITLPQSIKKLDRQAFCKMESLQSITLNEGLETIGHLAFAGNTKLTEIYIPQSVVNVEESTFKDCTSLEKVQFEGDAPNNFISEDLHYAGMNVHYTIYYHPEAKGFTSPIWNGYVTQKIGFESELSIISDFGYITNEENGITILKYFGNESNLVIPERIEGKPVTKIGMSAFINNNSLVSLTMPDTITQIEQKAFCDSSLQTITLSKNLQSIGDYAFYSCSNLSSIALPDSLTSLGNEAFGNCSNLKHIYIPKNITNWGKYTFNNSGLESIELEEGVQTIGIGAFSYTPIQTLVLPQSLRVIPQRAFAQCEKLTSITLKEGLTTIEDYAFEGSRQLTEIVIPQTVTNITELAFNFCTKLKAVKFDGNAPDVYLSEESQSATAKCDYTIYYHKNAKGFSSPEWNGYPTQIW